MLCYKNQGDGNMYRIRFAPYLTSPSSKEDKELNCIRVYHDDLDMIKLFLRQHGFDKTQTMIESIPDTYGEKDFNGNYLKYYNLKSIEDNQVHSIVTSDNLYDLAIDYVVNELNQYLLFGEVIMRDDIQIISIIQNLLSEIPFTDIIDYELMDRDLDDIRSAYNRYHSDEYIDEFHESHMSTYNCANRTLGDQLIAASSKDGVSVITLEAYVKSFVSLIQYKDCFRI